MQWDHALLGAARLASAMLATVVAVFAIRAYLALRRRNMLFLGAAAATLASGFYLEGFLVETRLATLYTSHAIEAAITLVALCLFVGSLYVHEPRAPRARVKRDRDAQEA